ncbi:type IV pilus assembly protein FimV [Sulfuricystis multivorans]|uniref:type IV pilus assembly protein FimV n=1 Tax=Sulfuricystis multivorans TaxID=2211108 RepID=UPI0011D02B4D|nr:hypothetical protein [Sulfuricystis multivorans]
MRTISDEAFQRWIKEDTQVVQGILTGLTHIDALLADIERMVRHLPDLGAMPKPAPAPPPVVVEKTVVKEVEVPGPLGGWMPTLSGAALLALLAFWLGRKQAAKSAPTMAKAKIAEPAAASAVAKRGMPPAPPPAIPQESPAQRAASTPTPTPSAPAAPAPTLVQPVPTSVEPVPSSIEATPAEETDQAIELAEVMLSMGLGHGAVQTLTEQIRNEPKQALRHWLKLLEIYRRNGQQAEFERSAEELRLHFNVRPEDWHPQGIQQTLENFPHIAKRLTELWGTADCLVYMQNLLADNRGGARSGFPQPVAEELLMLIAVMRAAYFG